MDNVKKHFEEEAKEFDGKILKLVPLYGEMIDALVTAIPFDRQKSFKVLDLGCGTGEISKRIKEKFPNSKISCLDFAENMIELAKIKLHEYNDVTYYAGDFKDFKFPRKYDAVVSSLALHHLITDDDKKQVYKKIFDNLLPGGVFYNADVVLGSNDYLQELYLIKWKEFMTKNVSVEYVEKEVMPKYYDEDHPARLTDHIKWLTDIGFKDVDVIWKYYMGAVYGGVKKIP